MNVSAGQVKAGAVLSLLSEQPALGLPCTICVTRRKMGCRDVVLKFSTHLPKYLRGESRALP